MAHKQQIEFCKNTRKIFPDHFLGRRVLDIGSLDVNGNNRFLFDHCEYIGIDVSSGSNVDVVSIGHLYDAPDESFDTIISTEVFEHDMFYEDTIKNVIRMLKTGGAFVFTCASTGRPEHGTRLSDGSMAAPLLTQISEEWSDYYKNLTEEDIRNIHGFEAAFPDGIFQYNPIVGDLYFFGVKGGMSSESRNKLSEIPQINSEFQVSFDMVPRIEMGRFIESTKHVEFIGLDHSNTEFSVYKTQLGAGMWGKPNMVYFKNWKVRVDGEDVFETNISFDSVCAVVASYPNSTDVKNKTVETIRNIRENLNIPTICSTHIDYAPNPDELTRETDYYLMNPINTITSHTHYRYYRGSRGNYNIFFDLWETGNGSYHGPAVHQCYWNGVKLAKQLGYKYAILTNFDMLFSANDFEKIRCVLNTVITNKTGGFFLHTIGDEGPLYFTVMCVVDVDMFLRKFPFEILDEADYNTLFKVSNSESNGLENMYYHILRYENLTIVEGTSETFFDSEKCNTNSQGDYLAIIPMQSKSERSSSEKQCGIFIKKSNKNVFETQLELSVIEVGRQDPILEKNMTVNTTFETIVPVLFDIRKNYEIILVEKEDTVVVKKTRRTVYAFQDLEKNGLIVET